MCRLVVLNPLVDRDTYRAMVLEIIAVSAADEAGISHVPLCCPLSKQMDRRRIKL